MKEIDFLVKDVDVSELKTSFKKHYEIPWIKDNTQALKSICMGHNCTITKDEVLDVLKSNGIDINIRITESENSYRLK